MRKENKNEWLRAASGAAAAVVLVVLLLPLGIVWGAGHIKEIPKPQEEESLTEPAACEKVKLPQKIRVWQEEQGKTVSVDFETYVTCVTASEMPSSFEPEALKAQSVAARTFAAAKLKKYETHRPKKHPDAPVCDTTHCQVYKDEKALADCHPREWAKSRTGWQKVREACKETKGKVMYYDGKLVMQPLFFSSSGGQTENAEDVFVSAVPYLLSVSSPYEEGATHTNERSSFTLGELRKKLAKAFPKKQFGDIRSDNIKILSRSAGGRVLKMQIGEATLSGVEVRSALRLSSALFSISFDGEDKKTVIVTSNGSGHGVGMSQYGANGMAKEGCSYPEILQHYYAGITVS